ncbi:hypothetical protein ACJX0J_025654, partial [Zea mays]
FIEDFIWNCTLGKRKAQSLDLLDAVLAAPILIHKWKNMYMVTSDTIIFRLNDLRFLWEGYISHF